MLIENGESGQPAIDPERCPALMVLRPRERGFVLAYARTGHGTNSAIAAGYAAHSAEVTASKLLRKSKIIEAVDAVAVLTARPAIGTINELRQHWTRIMRGDPVARSTTGQIVPASIAMRLRASELLGRSLGCFLDRTEHSGQVSLGRVVVYVPDDGRDSGDAGSEVIDHAEFRARFPEPRPEPPGSPKVRRLRSA